MSNSTTLWPARRRASTVSFTARLHAGAGSKKPSLTKYLCAGSAEVRCGVPRPVPIYQEGARAVSSIAVRPRKVKREVLGSE